MALRVLVSYPSPDTPHPVSRLESYSLTRRQALKVMAYSAVVMGAPAESPPLARAVRRRSGDEPRVVREMRRMLEETFQNREMALYLSHLDENHNEEFIIQIHTDRVYPVASSFKAAAVLYYYLYTPQDEWKDGPGENVYSMAVYSNNGKTGRVLYEVAQRLGRPNPIEAFNDFLIDPALLGLTHGLYRWTFEEFYTPTNGYSDERFNPAKFKPVAGAEKAANFSTVGEIAQIFRTIAQAELHPRWETDSHFRAAIEASRRLLSISIQQYITPLEKAIAYADHYSKEGILRPVDIGINVRNDAGVWIMPGGGSFLISFMSAMETDVAVEEVLLQVAEAMRMYQRYRYPNQFARNTRPSEPTHPGELDYGLVRETGVELFTAPDFNAPRIENPVRPTSMFGTTYLMYGAMVRFRVLDDDWAEIIADDRWDDTFPWPVYIPVSKLQVLGRGMAEPIGHVTGASEEVEKFIILDIYNRLLTLFEGGTPVLKTPTIVNPELTPRSISLMERHYLTRNMPNYPGVPFTTFLHGTSYLDSMGFAVHGSPWHLWGDTVRQSTLIRRFTHGCVNIPDWEISIPYLNQVMRPDEFIFRWAGGFPNPAVDHVYINKSASPVRVFGLDNVAREIFDYPPLDSLRLQGIRWRDVLDALEAKSIDAPESFFR